MMKNNEIYSAIDKCKITRSYRRILVGLVSFHLKGKAIYGSYEYYAKNWGDMSRKTVQRGIKFLEQSLKLIDVDRNHGTTNKIKFIVTMDELVYILREYEKDKTIPQNVLTPQEHENVEQNVQLHGKIDITKGQNVQTTEDKLSPYIETIIETNKRNHNEDSIPIAKEVVGSRFDLDRILSSTINSKDDLSSKLLQQYGISPKETLSSTVYEFLHGIENLENYLNKENKIQYQYWKGKYFLTDTNGISNQEAIPEPPFGFDARVFQPVRVEGTQIINTNGEGIKMGSINLIVQYLKGLTNDSNCKEYDLKKLKQLSYLSQC